MPKSLFTAHILLPAFFLFSIPVNSAPAKDVLDSLPSQTVVFIDFAGADRCAEAAAKTPFGRIWNHSGITRLRLEIWNAIRKSIMNNMDNEHDQKVGQASFDLLQLVWHKGITIDLINVAMGQAGPTFNLVAAVNAGDQCDKLETLIEQLIELCPLNLKVESAQKTGREIKTITVSQPAVPPVSYSVVDGVFWIYVGDGAIDRVDGVESGDSPALSSNKQFNQAMERVLEDDSQPIFTMYLAETELLGQARAISEQLTGQAGLPTIVESILVSTGIGDIADYAVAHHLTNNGFRSTWYASTPNRRKGFLKIFEQQPLVDSDLVWLPRDSSFASAINLDPSTAYDEFLKAVSLIPFPIKHHVEQAAEQFHEWSGLRLREDVLAALGDGLAAFDAPSGGGVLFGGISIVIEVKNQETVQRLIEKAISHLIKKMDKEPRAEQLKFKHGNVEVHYLQFKTWPIPVAPAWCYVNGRLMIGFTPQALIENIDRIVADDAQSQSILANKEYLRLRKMLPGDAVALQFFDTPRGINELYRYIILGGIAGISAARGHDIEIDAAMLPTLTEVRDGVGGDLALAIVDDDSITFTRHGSWPIPVPNVGLGSGTNEVVLISILLPSLSRARELSKRLVSAANLKGIGTACHIYAADHDGKFPDNLDQLVEGNYIVEKMLNAPSAGPGVRSYVYRPNVDLDSPNPQTTILAYEDYPGMTDEGANVLFLDGHVEFVRQFRAKQPSREQADMGDARRSRALRQLAAQLVEFTNDYMRFPESFDEMMENEYLESETLISPSGSRYVLVDGVDCIAQSDDAIHNTIIVHENAGSIRSGPLCVMFCDFHVECLPREKVAALLQAAE